MIEINGCTKSRDKNILSQDLKNHEPEVVISVIKANGVRRTKTPIIMYLREYENKRLIKHTDIKLFNKPSKENTFIVDASEVITEFKLLIKEEKLISSPSKFCPICVIAAEIKCVKYMKNSQM